LGSRDFYLQFFRKIHLFHPCSLTAPRRQSARLTISRFALLAGMLAGSTMSLSTAETYLQNAKQQVSQRDINDSLMKAVAELTREIKRLEDEVRRVRRDVQVSRRF
jgi:uncharacterized protein YlxW (UPF0749 family)